MMDEGSVPCNLCGASDHVALLTGATDGTPIVECRSCGLVYQSPRPTDEELAAIYGADYFTGVDRSAYVNYVAQQAERRPENRALLALVQERVRIGRLLEVGCATGFFLAEAREAGFETFGVEISQFAAGWGRRELRLDIRQGALRDVFLPRDSFDAACLWDVIEHLPDPAGDLARLFDVLVPGGWVFIRTQNIASTKFERKRAAWPYVVRPHLTHFSHRTLAVMLRRAGFREVTVQPEPSQAGAGWKRLRRQLQERLLESRDVKPYDLMVVTARKPAA
jgi:SAM-dependent methyltransferase